MKTIRILSVLLVVIMAVSACASPTPTEAPATQAPEQPTTAPVVQPTAIPPTEAPTNTPAPTPVASVPKDAVQQAGKLLVCSDLPYPPMEYFDENGNPVGADIDIANEIGTRLGLKVTIVNSVFDTIIAAVKGGKCDVIISDMNITAERSKQVSQIPYFQAGQSMLVAKGNPSNINAPTDLCGQSVAAESGTTEVDYLQGTGDYKGKGLTADCTKAGKKPPTVVVTQKDTDALQQLQSGKVATYFADTPVAAYYVVQHPDQFQVVGQVVDPALVGFSLPCPADQTDCTKAPLTPLGQAIQTAFKSMVDDGTYDKILAKWQLTTGAYKPS